MRIDAAALGALSAPTSHPARKAGGASFAVEAGRPEKPGAARASAPLATLDAILMLQGEGEDPRERRRRSARRGQDLLDALDGLRASLLAGAVAPADLRRIADRLARDAGPTGDPTLDGLVGAIELRAQVELAKLGAG